MANYREVTGGRRFMGRCAHGADLLAELTAVCRDNGVTLGRVEAIGALQRAKLGYYRQDTKVYEYHEFAEPTEILALVGNVSIKDGQPMVHAHLTISDAAGRAFGGHLVPGTIVFACEFILQAFDGPEFRRALDATTGLPLWALE